MQHLKLRRHEQLVRIGSCPIFFARYIAVMHA